MTSFFPQISGNSPNCARTHDRASFGVRTEDEALPLFSLGNADPEETCPCTVCPKRIDCSRYRECKPWLAWVTVSWECATAPLRRTADRA